MILPVFIVFAFLGCILGLVPLLLVYTLVCRSFESDEIAIDRIKDATTKSRRKGQFRISPIEGEPMATVVFKANDASELIKGLQRNP